MKTTSKISKSAVMKRAWSIYKKHRDMFPTFSEALKRAWRVEKETIIYNARMQEENGRIERYKRLQAQPAKPVQMTEVMQQSLIDYYSRSGAYCGD